MQPSRITFEFSRDKNLVLGHASGLLDFFDFELHMLELSQSVDLSTGPDGLYDFSQVSNIQGSIESWEQTAHQICAIEPARKGVKIAIVVGNNESLNRIFDGWLVIMALSDYQYQLFATKEQAREWLNSAD